MFDKNRRIVDHKLLEAVRLMPCVVCGATPSDPHHMKTVKSGGGDLPSNLIPLCRKDHMACHASGMVAFVKKYPHLYEILIEKGWYLDHNLKKWISQH